MMKYLKDEVKLLQGIGFKEEIQQAIDNILDGYNRVFNIAVNQQEYIKTKQPEYAKTMEDNFKLMDRNKYLESEYKRLRNAYKDQADYVRGLEKELRRLRKLVLETKEETWKD